MALPMDEQRILDEIEKLLAADDPRFAARLSSFGKPGVRDLLRTKRSKTIASVVAVAVVVVIAVICYMAGSLGLGVTPSGKPSQQASSAQTLKPTAAVPGQLPVSGPGSRP